MTTATVITVMHDAHVACRTSFVAARTAMVRKATARRVAAATRSATYVANRTATKAANAAKVAAKEAAEKHASVVSKWEARVQARAMAKAANAPAANAAKKAAAVVAKLLKAANAARLAAVRATRAAAKATAVVKAATTRATTATTRSTTADVRATRAAIVAFLAMTPCLCALWFYATLHIATKAATKETSKAANRIHATVKAPRVCINDEAKRASITMACANARAAKAAKHAADAHAIASHGNTLSDATVAARAAQGDAQRAANAIRALARMVETKPSKKGHIKGYVVGMSDTPILGKLVGTHSDDARHKSTHVVHATHNTKVADARGEFKTLASAKKAAKAALVIEQAAKWAMRKEAAKNRKAAMEQIASDAWMMKGIWLPEDLIKSANDWSYTVRVNAFKEARNIAYPKAPVALVGVAA